MQDNADTEAVIARIEAWAHDHKKSVNYDDGESYYIEVRDLVAFLKTLHNDGTQT